VDAEVGKHIESKTDAEALADHWRSAIRAGTYRRRGETPTETPAVGSEVLSLAKFVGRYEERRARPVSERDRQCLKQLVAYDGLGAKAITAITEDDLEAFFASVQSHGRAASTMNKFVQALRALFRWAMKKGYLQRDPVAQSEVIKRQKHARRARRLREGEEAKLLAAAPPHLQRLIIAAVECGGRRGELLALRWSDVNLDRRQITIRPETSKTKTGRVLPISARLLAVLGMARIDPSGRKYTEDRFVFGEVGQQLKTVKRAWQTAVVRAEGHTPAWTKSHALDARSQAVFRRADLQFRDLRHECGSRLLENGWPLHHVQAMLGHTSVSTTAIYLNYTQAGLHQSMQRLDAARCNPVASNGRVENVPPCNDDAPNVHKPLIN
jgi:integrase